VIPAPGETEEPSVLWSDWYHAESVSEVPLDQNSPRPACLTASNMSVTAVYRRVALSAGMLSLTDLPEGNERW